MGLGVLIGLPCWQTWDVRFSMCLQSLAPPMNFQTRTLPVIGKRIDIARNEIVETALRDEAEFVLFLDTDVLFPPTTFQQLLLRQRNNPEHMMVSGVYWSKSNPSFPLIFHESGRGSYMNWKAGDYFKTWAVGMGLVLINTNVFKNLEPPWYTVDYGLTVDPETGGGMSSSMTEDLPFCDRVNKAGMEIWVDTGIQAGHLEKNSGMIFGINEAFPQAQGREPRDAESLYVGNILAGGEPCHVLATDPIIKPTFVGPPEKVPMNGDRYTSVHVKDPDILPESIEAAVKEWSRVTRGGGKVEILTPNYGKMLESGGIIKRAMFGPAVYEDAMKKNGLLDIQREERGDYWLITADKRQYDTPLVSIIIVAHGLEDMTRACIKSIRDKTKHEDFNYEIVVVDNGSPEPLQMMGDTQIRNEENLPFGQAVETGIKAASDDSPYFVFLNNDTAIIQEEWLANLLERIRGNGRIGAIGPKQLQPNGTIYHTEIAFGEDRVPFHAFAGFSHDHQTVQTEKEVIALNFGCILIRREAWNAVGNFDEQYGSIGNYEDIDWCLRARKMGVGLVFTPSSEIIHFGAMTQREDPKTSVEAVNTNRAKFVEKWKDEGPELFGLPKADVEEPEIPPETALKPDISEETPKSDGLHPKTEIEAKNGSEGDNE